MARQSFSLKQIDEIARGKEIASVTVYYKDREMPVNYPWLNRGRIVWDNVKKCRLDFKNLKSYNIDGEGCRRPGFKVKPK